MDATACKNCTPVSQDPVAHHSPDLQWYRPLLSSIGLHPGFARAAVLTLLSFVES